MKKTKRKLSESEKMDAKICYYESKTNSQDSYDRYHRTIFYLILNIDNLNKTVSLCEIDHKIINANPPDDELSENKIHYIANLESVSAAIIKIPLENFKDNYIECDRNHEGTSSITYNPQQWCKIDKK